MWLVQKQWDLKPISVSLSVIKQVGVDLYSLQVIDGYCHVVKVSLSKKVKLHLSKTSQVQQYPNFYTRLFNWFVWKSRQMAWSQGLSREIQIGRAFRRNALHMTQTAWKASKYWVFSGSYFPVCRLNTEIYGVNLRIQSKYKKIRTKKNSAFEHFLRFKFSKIQIINLVSSIR